MRLWYLSYPSGLKLLVGGATVGILEIQDQLGQAPVGCWYGATSTQRGWMLTST
jgi:hypothetical protein